MDDNRTYKTVIIGDARVGKTSFMKCFLESEVAVLRHEPNLDVDIYALTFNTTRGPVYFEVWDIKNQQAGGKLPDSYYEDSNCAIMMFDISSKSSYNKLPKWHQELVDGCKDKNIRMVLIGNMTDDKNRKVKKSDVTFRRKSGLQYYEIPVKDKVNLGLPFLCLARQLLHDANLGFSYVVPKLETRIDMDSEHVDTTPVIAPSPSYAELQAENVRLSAENIRLSTENALLRENADLLRQRVADLSTPNVAAPVAQVLSPQERFVAWISSFSIVVWLNQYSWILLAIAYIFFGIMSGAIMLISVISGIMTIYAFYVTNQVNTYTWHCVIAGAAICALFLISKLWK